MYRYYYPQYNYYYSTPYPQPFYHPFVGNLSQRKKDPYPLVNVDRLRESARRFPDLMAQGKKLVNEIEASEDFSKELKEAAQRGNKQEVNQIIENLGITDSFETSFTPDNIHIIISPKDEKNCCDFVMTLYW